MSHANIFTPFPILFDFQPIRRIPWALSKSLASLLINYIGLHITRFIMLNRCSDIRCLPVDCGLPRPPKQQVERDCRDAACASTSLFCSVYARCWRGFARAVVRPGMPVGGPSRGCYRIQKGKFLIFATAEYEVPRAVRLCQVENLLPYAKTCVVV